MAKEVKDVEEDENSTENNSADSDEDSLEEEILQIEDFIEEDSNFSVRDNVLSPGFPVHSWDGQNLEDVIDKEKIEKDWGSEEDFGKFSYEANSGVNVYANGASSNGYDVNPGNDVSSAYDSGGLYSAENSKGSVPDYDLEDKRVKSVNEIDSERRGEKSMLEVAGFRDEEMEKKRKSHGLL